MCVEKLNKTVWEHNIRIKHKICGDEFIVRLYNFKISPHCPYCMGTKTNHRTFLEKFKNKRKDWDEYEFLTEYERNDKYVTVKHIPCGRIFDITPTALIHTKDKCACVYGRYTNKHTFDILYQRIKEIDSNYTLIDVPNKDSIHTNKDKVVFRHEKCGTEFKTRPHSFIHNGIRCPVCNKSILNAHDSFGVVAIEMWIRSKSLKYVREKTFNDLLSPKNRKLRFDFYIPDMNLIIEYDGKQHFDTHTNRIFTQESYDRIHLHDDIKNKYCKKNNIDLIRIDYRKTVDEIYHILDDKFNSSVYVYEMQTYYLDIII